MVSFNDQRARDVSEFVAKLGTSDEIADRIGRDWVQAKAISLLDRDDLEDADAPPVTIYGWGTWTALPVWFVFDDPTGPL